jgi:hypothetical protein
VGKKFLAQLAQKFADFCGNRNFITVVKRVILPVVLNGCETWSLTLKEEHRLKVFENTVLKRIFGPKR